MISERVLQARMAEVGRIKIGGLDEAIRTTKDGQKWQAPVKFDHFVITGMDRDGKGNFTRDEVLHSIIGPQPKELKIRLIYNDVELNFRTELAYYQGKTCVCRGNGEVAQQLDKNTGELIEVACPCPKLEQEKNGCKPHGVLQCLLEQASLCGGVHKFATTSWNTIRSIVSSLKFIQTCTGGKLAGLPLTMKYFKKTTTKRDGGSTTIPVVTIVYEGNPVQMLEMAIETERKRIQAGIQLETLEAQVRREMNSTLLLTGPLDDDDVPEFHPEGDLEDDMPPAGKTIGQAISESNAAEEAATAARLSAAAPKPEAPKKTAKPKAAEAKPPAPETKTPVTAPEATKYTCSACGRTSDSPGACKCAEGKTETKTAVAAPVTTPAAPSTPPAATAAATPARGDMMKEITSTRAQKRIQTADWQAIVTSVGLKDLNAASWSDAEMFKVLTALRAK